MGSTRRIVLYVTYAVLVIAFGVVIGLAFQSSPSPKHTASNAPKHTASKPASPPSTASSSKPSPKPTTSAPNGPANPQLANSGPGDVIGIFVLTSVLAAIAHWRFRLRKLYL
jgi:hypothetical protein